MCFLSIYKYIDLIYWFIAERLDGLCKKKTENSIKEWLQIPEDYISEEVVVKDGKKRVSIFLTVLLSLV